MNFTKSESVAGVIDVPRYWEWRLAFGDDRFHGKIDNKRVYSQVRDHLLIFSIKNKISQEIKR